MKRFLSAICGVAAALAAALPASASNQCWAGDPTKTEKLAEVHCEISKRTNANGHTVLDFLIDEGDGPFKTSVIFWYEQSGDSDGPAEIFHEGNRLDGYWLIDKDGDYQVGLEGHRAFMAFTAPTQDVTPPAQPASGRGTLSDTPFRF